jgi:hypothetical protein
MQAKCDTLPSCPSSAAVMSIDFLWTSIPTNMICSLMTCLLAVWLCATGPSRRVTHGVQEAGHFFNSTHSHCDSACRPACCRYEYSYNLHA